MAKRVSVDRWLFTVTMLLVFVGLVMVFSASAVMARERFGSPYAFLSKQLIWAAAGLVAMVVTMRVDYRRYKHPALVFSLMGVTTLLLISVFFLDRSHNTHRWIHAGGFSFQPSELAKPVLILFLAYFLEGRAKTMDDWRNTLAARGGAGDGAAGADRAAARPGYGDCLRRDRGLHPLCGGDAAAVFRLCVWGVAGAALFSDLSCELAARPDFGVYESVCRPAEGWVPH